jgi:N-acetylglucosamine kinase-like BadF-type ATPase
VTTPSLLVGVDGGQTATKVLVADRSGRMLAAGRGRAFDHFRAKGGVENNRAAIREGVEQALAAAGSGIDAVAAIALGLTGVRTGSPESVFAEDIARELLPGVPQTVVADYESNLAGANGGQPGVVVIAGGGSIGFGVTADGRQAITSGYGYLLGDEGSAYSIGRAAIIAAARARDGRDEQTALQQIVLDALGVDEMRGVPAVVYSETFTRDGISQLAPLVVRAAEDGDAVASRIVTWAGNELALTALAVIKRLFEPGEQVSVAITGGVFSAGEAILGPFRTTLAEQWPGATPHTPRFPPAVGAVIFAARAAGIEPDEAWLERVGETLPQ